MTIQHICEEHIKVPIPYPVKNPYHEKPRPHPDPKTLFVTHDLPSQNQGYRNYLTTPIPAPPPPSAYQGSVLGEPLVGNLLKRQTRSAGREQDHFLHGLVEQMLLEAMQKKNFRMKARDFDKKEHSADQIDFQVDSSHNIHFNIHPPESFHTNPHHLVHDPNPSSHHKQPAHLISYPLSNPAPEHPPIVTSYELPSQPGCRSLATKTCYKIPIIVPKKVPFEICRDVPDVECVTVVKNKPEIECTPEPYEECNDVAKDIPYLEPGEECEEIVYDECREVNY